MIATQTQIPYGYEIQKNALTQGSHTLTVTFKGGNGYEKIKNFALTKDVSDKIKIIFIKRLRRSEIFQNAF
ncbi:MAG TPA: hypothetical protein IAB62_08385 [Candidatus Coprocola pullicola]|nr:hypothetical protein [Candidatus Coprocola pullicola]